VAIFKANYVKRGAGEKGRAKASIRYIQHRRGKDGERITRTLFGSDGAMSRKEAYRMIDEAQKGNLFYRFVVSPDPKLEDTGRDLDMRDLTMQTMQALEEQLHTPVLWVAAMHADHAPHRHIHVLAIVPKKLLVKDFTQLRARATEAALFQRRFLDRSQDRERERPYPLQTVASRVSFTKTSVQASRSPVASRPAAGARGPSRPLRTCACPRCDAVHVHNVRDPVHQCHSCGLILHRRKQPSLSLGKEAGWQR
jgi:hypothetical protein